MTTSTSRSGRPLGRPARWQFLPDRIWRFDMASGRSHGIDHATDPDAWRSAAESDDPLVTQWDDGAHEGLAPGTVPTSSSSEPRVVDAMEEAVELRRGLDLLEIGTGTGWTTARAANVLGDGHVTSIEVDAQVAARARTALAVAGYHPQVIRADGTLGHPDRAPYDRVFVTAGVREIPTAWLQQTRPGGYVVMPWGTAWSNLDLLLRLVVNDDGTASGHFLGVLEFMKIRSQRQQYPVFTRGAALEQEQRIELPPHGRWDAWTAVAGLYLPGLSWREDGGKAWLHTADCTSWAQCHSGRVHQVGTRHLWTELERAVDSWRRSGEPGWSRFGMTVTPSGASATVTSWLDDPANGLVV